MDVIAGTAGHIDHGKTALIKALTGVDTDRLPEEKQRGITIDLGFAEMSIGDVRFGFVDVPGHERFIKNMLAGASGIDIVMLIVAADEGVMPQTREHFEICRLLGIKAGIIVITKTDIVDEESIDLVKLEIGELVTGSFLSDAEVVAVSTKNGTGLEHIVDALKQAASKMPTRDTSLITRLPIDRSFSVKGFGTVVTGTLVSGEIGDREELEILPDQKLVRIRGLQTHGRTVGQIVAGQRGAVNLGGVDKDMVVRGMTLAYRDQLRPTQLIDARLQVLTDAKRPLRSRQRVRVHIGTAELLARLVVLNEAGEIDQNGSDLCQLRLESPIVSVPGEKFVLRGYSPPATIAGGTVIDALPPKHKRRDTSAARDFLERLENAADQCEVMSLFVESSAERGTPFSELQARTGYRSEILNASLDACAGRNLLIAAGALYLSRQAFDGLKVKMIAELAGHHERERLSKGMSKETLREKAFAYVHPEVFRAVISDLEKNKAIAVERDIVRSIGHETKLSADENVVMETLRHIYNDGRMEVPRLDDALAEATRATRIPTSAARKVFRLLVDSGDIVKITDEFYFPRTVLDGLQDQLKDLASKGTDRSIDVAKFKELAGISRKYAIPLLEYFDREKVTKRAGDKRIIL